jgi:hypothetical protein
VSFVVIKRVLNEMLGAGCLGHRVRSMEITEKNMDKHSSSKKYFEFILEWTNFIVVTTTAIKSQLLFIAFQT